MEESLEIIRTVFSAEGMWAVELKETSEVIGSIGYLPALESNLDIKEDQCEIGYWIAKPYWNKGLCHRLTGFLLFCLPFAIIRFGALIPAILVCASATASLFEDMNIIRK